jgi:hypothetical protein
LISGIEREGIAPSWVASNAMPDARWLRPSQVRLCSSSTHHF